MIDIPANYTNSDHSRLGRVFQELTANLLSDYYGVSFDIEIEIPIGEPAKLHSFDCVSVDKTIAVECKCYTWTKTGNVPSAKLAYLNQSVLYASLLPDGVKKVIVIQKARHRRRTETLAEYYYRTYRHLLSGITLLEIDTKLNTVRHIGQP